MRSRWSRWTGRPLGGRPARARRDRGATTLELAMYMPILILVIFFTVQEALLFLGNQAASAAAREAARVAREEPGDLNVAIGDGVVRGQEYAISVGHGLIEDVAVTIVPVGAAGNQEVRATVTARGVQVMPGFPGQHITQVSQGPVEGFRADTGGGP